MSKELSYLSDADSIPNAKTLILFTLEYLWKRNFPASNSRRIYIM